VPVAASSGTSFFRTRCFGRSGSRSSRASPHLAQLLFHIVVPFFIPFAQEPRALLKSSSCLASSDSFHFDSRPLRATSALVTATLAPYPVCSRRLSKLRRGLPWLGACCRAHQIRDLKSDPFRNQRPSFNSSVILHPDKAKAEGEEMKRLRRFTKKYRMAKHRPASPMRRVRLCHLNRHRMPNGPRTRLSMQATQFSPTHCCSSAEPAEILLDRLAFPRPAGRTERNGNTISAGRSRLRTHAR
jgi:hypothetical protein